MNQNDFHHFPTLLQLLAGSGDDRLCAGLSFCTLLSYGSSSDPAAEARDPPLKPPKAGVPYDFFPDTTPPPYSSQLSSLLSPEQPHKKPPIQNLRSEMVSYKKPRCQRARGRGACRSSCRGTRRWTWRPILEEHKYIRFLRAQIRRLRRGDGGECRRRQGSGEVEPTALVLSSPVAQAQLYTKGCVYSSEQMVWLRKKAEGEALHREMMLGLAGQHSNSFH
ncbi:transcription factor bHLH117 [Striga asiatica]|uniref:Transcription factor bHLH117 n=1 Tax=Striga asiatica TaxID=4170 RepID=A0A5A7PFR6_STRAF|nr:transcription factor bHLH117 [Striga asiatica]